MITIPDEGTTWDLAGLGNVDNRFLERGKLVQVLARDARGAATNISPHNPDGTPRFSLFAKDGTWRSDLFARRKVNGAWVRNPEPNEGFFLIGAFKDGDGPSDNPKIDNDVFKILQSDYPFDTAIVGQARPISFTPVQTADPAVRRLDANMRFTDDNGNDLVELPGTLGVGWGEVLDAENVDRQIFTVRERSIGGRKLRVVKGYELCKLDDMGKSKYDKRDSQARELTYQPQPGGYMMAMVDGEYVPVLSWTWVGGDAWPYIAGPPILGTVAPVATAGATGKATLVLADPIGVDPFTITGEKSTDNGATWAAATNDSPGDVTSTGGSTTLKLKGLSAGAVKLRAVVLGANGLTARTLASNAVTIS